MHPAIERGTKRLAGHAQHLTAMNYDCGCDAVAPLLAHVSNIETLLDRQADEMRDMRSEYLTLRNTLSEIANDYYHDAHAIQARAALDGA